MHQLRVDFKKVQYLTTSQGNDMSSIEIPNYKSLSIQHLVLDYNGTIAKDGILIENVKVLLQTLCQEFKVYVITADTFGSVHQQLEGINVTVIVLSSDDHTQEKAAFIESLGAVHCAAIGNGNNDAKMLERAAVGIALLGDEGLCSTTFLKSDLVCKNIEDALELFIHKKRLIATLRA